MPITLTIGSTEIKVPDYVICLSQEDICKLLTEGNPNEKIIGAGVHKDGKVTFILASGAVTIFDPSEYFVPAGPFIPQEDGYTVFLPNTDNRWPIPTKGFSVQSSWLIQKSKSAFNDTELFVNNKLIGKFEFEFSETNKVE